MKYHSVLQFALYSHLREDASPYPLSQIHDTDIYRPADTVFPRANAAEAALKELDDPRFSQLHDIDSVPAPCVDAEITRKTRRVYMAYARMFKIGECNRVAVAVMTFQLTTLNALLAWKRPLVASTLMDHLWNVNFLCPLKVLPLIPCM